MEEGKKGPERNKSASMFDYSSSWLTKYEILRREDWLKANERLATLSGQNTEALLEAFQLGFIAGIHVTQDAIDNETKKGTEKLD